MALTLTGCIHEPQLVPLSRQKIIDRSVVEYPAGCRLVQMIKGLNCPTSMCWNGSGDLLIAESGIDGSEPHIFGYHKDGSYFNIYPWKRTISFYPTGFVIYGPIGGMAADHDRIFVSHRDRNDKGVITALGYDGTHTTLKANLPAQGDYGVTDVVVRNGKVYFGIGTATNSGVVGLDNYDAGWLKRHPEVRDQFYSPTHTPIKGQGFRFDTLNPWKGLFAGELSVTGFGQPFGHSIESRIQPVDEPNGAVCSISVDGGPVTVEAFGLHNPRGIALDEYDHPFITNDGMQMRGTRPVADDPDSLLKVSRDTWYGWPDYTTDGHKVSDAKYAPPLSMLVPTGYSEISLLIDQATSDLSFSQYFSNSLIAIFPSLSGASKMDFIPASGPFNKYAGNILVALMGDESPYVTPGAKLLKRQGFKVDLVEKVDHVAKDFIRNTAGVPASMLPFGTVALERPCDVKVGPDGAIYILDFGRMDNNTAVPRYYPGSGGLFKLDGPLPSTNPDTQK